MKETLLLILFAGLSLASVFSYLVYRPLTSWFYGSAKRIKAPRATGTATV
jgi:hypothetical protein